MFSAIQPNEDTKQQKYFSTEGGGSQAVFSKCELAYLFYLYCFLSIILSN
jgi:hypothetical protein